MLTLKCIFFFVLTELVNLMQNPFPYIQERNSLFQRKEEFQRKEQIHLKNTLNYF